MTGADFDGQQVAALAQQARRQRQRPQAAGAGSPHPVEGLAIDLPVSDQPEAGDFLLIASVSRKSVAEAFGHLSEEDWRCGFRPALPRLDHGVGVVQLHVRAQRIVGAANLRPQLSGGKVAPCDLLAVEEHPCTAGVGQLQVQLAGLVRIGNVQVKAEETRAARTAPVWASPNHKGCPLIQPERVVKTRGRPAGRRRGGVAISVCPVAVSFPQLAVNGQVHLVRPLRIVRRLAWGDGLALASTPAIDIRFQPAHPALAQDPLALGLEGRRGNPIHAELNVCPAVGGFIENQAGRGSRGRGRNRGPGRIFRPCERGTGQQPCYDKAR